MEMLLQAARKEPLDVVTVLFFPHVSYFRFLKSLELVQIFLV